MHGCGTIDVVLVPNPHAQFEKFRDQIFVPFEDSRMKSRVTRYCFWTLLHRIAHLYLYKFD